MTTLAWVLLAAATVTAVVDWVAVMRGDRATEYVCKPATLLLLVGAAMALDPADPTQRTWFVVALVLSLAGDVFLMLPSDRFVAGLASFLLAHLAYIAGLRLELDGNSALLTVVVVGAAYAIGNRVMRSVEGSLRLPVAVYMVVITAMAALAVNTGDWRAAVGAVLFMASDSLIAWNRFVQPVPYARLAIMSTYHLAQGLLVLSLLDR